MPLHQLIPPSTTGQKDTNSGITKAMYLMRDEVKASSSSSSSSSGS
jgi:hypothetical protein